MLRRPATLASFSSRYPLAVHVLPLHALKGVLASGALVAKSQIPVSQQRRTTRGVDASLGFTDVVHFYLSRPPEAWRNLPILETQLCPSSDPPFPHVALALLTSSLTDEECAICLWNIAVSRPQVAGLRGGNWTRGTKPERIAQVWQSFKDSKPSMERARGQWNAPARVPTLEGPQITQGLSLFSRAAGRCPELLLRAPVSLRDGFRLWVFSKEDADVAGSLMPTLPMELHAWPGYDAICPETESWRDRIRAYFEGSAPYPKDLDFDRIRRSTKRRRRGIEPQ